MVMFSVKNHDLKIWVEFLYQPIGGNCIVHCVFFMCVCVNYVYTELASQVLCYQGVS